MIKETQITGLGFIYTHFVNDEGMCVASARVYPKGKTIVIVNHQLVYDGNYIQEDEIDKLVEANL